VLSLPINLLNNGDSDDDDDDGDNECRLKRKVK